MNTLDSLRPEKVFAFFREIAAIPHGSGNTAQIAQYCLDFAAARGLKAVLDKGGNVIIWADATPGYEHCKPVILQGHMDMVCEKTPECTKDLSKDGLTLCTDGEWLWADGTTLGGDDGIAIAYMFALLDSDDIPHPPLECVITRDEETGMFGAEELEASYLSGNTILNIDSEEEGILTVSCAGGITAHCDIPLTAPAKQLPYAYEISVSGLTGGHSGVDIGKGRLNAFKILCHPLVYAEGNPDFCIASITGGGKQNVIPQNAAVIIGTETDCFDLLAKNIDLCNHAGLGGEADPDLLFSIKKLETPPYFYDEETSDKILDFLANAPTGPTIMTRSIPPVVLTSLNMGVFALDGDMLRTDFLIRSNSASGKEDLAAEVTAFAERFGGTAVLDADYPAWEYREESPLRDLMVRTFCDLYGKEPVVSSIHAGLECGIFTKKIENADAISFGPDIEDIHTPKERLNLASAQRTWDYLCEVLKRMK